MSDADTEALSYSTEGKIKYAKERKRKHDIEKGLYKGSKARHMFKGGFGAKKPLVCGICKKPSMRLKSTLRKDKLVMACNDCLSKAR